MRTDDGRDFQLRREYLEHVHHGYAITGHVSQGITTDWTYLYARPERGGMEWGHVAGSRHRHDLHLYTTTMEPDQAADALVRGWKRSQAKTSPLITRTGAPCRSRRSGRARGLSQPCSRSWSPTGRGPCPSCLSPGTRVVGCNVATSKRRAGLACSSRAYLWAEVRSVYAAWASLACSLSPILVQYSAPGSASSVTERRRARFLLPSSWLAVMGSATSE